MVPFKGRSIHTVKLPGKPIPEGFKLWCLGSFEGYYYDWLIHSSIEGPEACSRKKSVFFDRPGGRPPIALSETFQVPIILCQRLKNRNLREKWVAFLDNLFLNLNVA